MTVRELVVAISIPALAGLSPASVLAQRVPQGTSTDSAVQQTPPAAATVRRLTLNDAVQLALEQNPDLQVERLGPSIQDEHVAAARAAFLPGLDFDLSHSRAESPPDSFLSGAGDILKDDDSQGQATIRQLLPRGGGSYAVGWGASRATSNSVFSNFNPRLRSDLLLSYSQPLMRDGSVDANRTQLRVSQRTRQMADDDFRAAVVQVIRRVKSAYWELQFTVAHAAVQRQHLVFARQALDDNRVRVQVGTLAAIDLVEAEAEVAINEEAVIVAESAVGLAEDELRVLIFDSSAPDVWRTRLEPVETPRLDPVVVDVDDLVRKALAGRVDRHRADLSIQNATDQVEYQRNQALPQLNLQVDYRASGLGGTNIERGEGFPGPVVGQVTRGVGDLLRDVAESAFPSWTVGVALSIPLGRSQAEAHVARARLERDQAEARLKSLDVQIGAQVRNVARQLNTSVRRIDAARAARLLSERRLEAEQRKLGAGTSTSFLVFQAQRDLATARVNELRAILDFNKSIADLEAVQETAVTVVGTGG